MCWRVCVPAWPVCLGEHFLQLTGSKGLKHVLEAPFLVVIIPQAVCGTINNFFTQKPKDSTKVQPAAKWREKKPRISGCFLSENARLFVDFYLSPDEDRWISSEGGFL